MDPEQREIRRLFDLVTAAPVAEREALLDRECADKTELRVRVQAMVAAAEDDHFLTSPTHGADADATVSVAPQHAQSEQIGPYKLLQEIGQGGFGSVWLAEQREPVKRRVALKIIKVGMDTKQVIARFEAERQALAMMEHPNIARVLDAGSTESGRPYFVMEYIRGEPIIEYCDKKKLDPRARLRLFVAVCKAIQHAHQKGIIHRDLKPSNVLVTLHDGEPVPKVIDFGIAKATNTELTQKTLFTEHQQLIGTPAYMSPEQAELSGLDVDTRSDVYSLGVLLYEFLTGTTPFDATELRERGLVEMMRVIREEEPHKPSTRVSSLGDTGTQAAEARQIDDVRRLGELCRGDLDWIVMKCLEKDRTRRYETANALANDVENYLRDDPVDASPPSAAYRLRKFVRRHRAAVVAASAMFLLLVLGVAGTTGGMFMAMNAERIAVTANAVLAQRNDVLSEVAYAALLQRAQRRIELGRTGSVAEEMDRVPEGERGVAWHWLRGQADADGTFVPVDLGGERPWRLNDLQLHPDGNRMLNLADISVSEGAATLVEFALDRSFAPRRFVHGLATHAVYGAEGEEVLVCKADGVVVRFADWNSAPTTIAETGLVATRAAFSSDRTLVAVGTGSGTVRVVRLRDSAVIFESERATEMIRSLAFSPNGERLLIGHDEVVVVDLPSRQEVARIAVGDLEVRLVNVVWHPDGKRGLIAGSRALLYNMEDGSFVREYQPTLKPDSRWCHKAAFSSDGRRLVTSGQDQIIRVFDAESGRATAHFGPPYAGYSQGPPMIWSHDGADIIAGGHSGVRVWSLAERTAPLPLRGHSGGVAGIAIAPDGRHAYSRGGTRLRKWDLQSGRQLWAAPVPGGRGLQLSGDGRVLGVPSGSGLALIDPNDGSEFRSVGEVQTDRSRRRSARGIVMSPDNASFVRVQQNDAVVELVSLETGAVLRSYPVSLGICWPAFSTDGRKLAIVSASKVRVWDLETQTAVELPPLFDPPLPVSREAMRRLTAAGRAPNLGAVFVAFDPKDRLWLGAPEGTVVIRNSQTGEAVGTLQTDQGIRDLDFDNEHDRALIIDHSGVASIWSTRHFTKLLELGSTGGPGIMQGALAPNRAGFLLAGRELLYYGVAPDSSHARERATIELAATVVVRLQDELLLPELVGEALEAESLPADSAEYAQELVNTLGTDASELGFEAYRIGASANASPAALQKAKRCAEVAIPKASGFGLFVARVGLAMTLYRLGEYQESLAVWSEQEIHELRSRSDLGVGFGVGLFASRALCFHYLGHEKEARRSLEDARRIPRVNAMSLDYGMLHEASERIERTLPDADD